MTGLFSCRNCAHYRPGAAPACARGFVLLSAPPASPAEGVYVGSGCDDFLVGGGPEEEGTKVGGTGP